MREQPILSDEEWELVLEMLRHERDDVRVEIHHARPGPGGKEDLQQQLARLDGLIARLQGAIVG